MLSLGIIASSFQVSAGLTFSTGTNIPGPIADSIAFVNGTAVISSGGTGSRYSITPAISTTLGGATIDSPSGSWGANGVVLKTGRTLGGTVAIARTADGGQTWATALNTNSSGDRIQTVAYANVSGTARWIAPVRNDNDVYLSTDNGSSFAAQSNVLGGTARNWIASTRMGSAFAVFNAEVTAYYTSEIGTTWTLRTLPNTLFDNDSRDRTGKIVASSDSVTMALDGDRVLTSGDLVSWSTAGTVPASSNATSWHVAYGADNWVVLAETDPEIEAFVSTNNGVSWSQITVEGSATASGSAVDIAFNDSDQSFYFISADGGTNRIWRTGA